jgi:hypothetical protein
MVVAMKSRSSCSSPRRAIRFKTVYDLSQIENDGELVYKAAIEFGGV